MKVTTAFGLAIALAIGVSAYGAELKSGLQPGDEVPAFEVVKVAGNPHDEVKIGEELCYRCKMGKRPMVVVFARKSDKNLAKLVHALDEVVAKNKDEKKMGDIRHADQHQRSGRQEGRREARQGRRRQQHRGRRFEGPAGRSQGFQTRRGR